MTLTVIPNNNTLTPEPSNPLLDFINPARFDDVRAEHIEPAMDALIERAQEALARVTSSAFKSDWDGIERLLDVQIPWSS